MKKANTNPVSIPKKLNLNSNLLGLFIFMIVVFFVMGAIKPDSYFSEANFQSMCFQFPEIGIFAIGVMFPMITGGIDLSMVGMANIASIVAAIFMTQAIPKDAAPEVQAVMVIVAFAIAVFVGLGAGLVNGTIITRLGTPPMIVTLGTQYVFMGLAVILTEGKPILGFPSFFAEIGNGTLAGIPIPLIIFVAIALVTYYILQKTPFGTKLYLIGSNIKASEYSGIRVRKVLTQTYGMAGLLSGIAGFILIARTNQANADYGTTYTLQSIMIAVLGGTNPNGGEGTVSGTIMAVLVMQFISTGMNMIGLDNVNFLRQLVWGVALIGVMVLNLVIADRKAKKAMRKMA